MGTNRLKRAAVAVTAGVALLTGLPAVPAQASGSCSSGSPAALWGAFSLQVRRTTSCTYYARFTISSANPNYGAGGTWSFKIERQVYTSYGWMITDSRSRTMLWGRPDYYDTATVDGYPASSGNLDQHHACYSVDGGGWTCTAWADL
ncbi:hypothetical protein [Micromonospora sp. NBC_01638]|uniref:hypothetical protein n=1 Tax=Micromonospora sp. NBC_01638 TaxID=2975982 RepID=UPI00386D4AD0|nr:hypothetical protein OG811_24045 [Micromonospora sp. NBC_01638]